MVPSYSACEASRQSAPEGGGDGLRTCPQVRFNSREDVRRLLGEKLREMATGGECPDTITFAGNGEPTMHPEFEAIVGDVLGLRDEICPGAKVSVLSNGTMIGRPGVRRALLSVDNNILKLDSAIDETVRLINNPAPGYSVRGVIDEMKRFEGRLVVQTMFLRGPGVDNTTAAEVSAWLEALREIRPERVMVYTIDRDTPAPDLEKVPQAELDELARLAEECLSQTPSKGWGRPKV